MRRNRDDAGGAMKTVAELRSVTRRFGKQLADGGALRRADMNAKLIGTFVRRLCCPAPTKRLLILTAAMAAGCAATPEDTAYEVADFRARWLDRLESERRECVARGGYIVQERSSPDRLRIGERRLEIGARYWCSR
jgi:hypothetical protein